MDPKLRHSRKSYLTFVTDLFSDGIVTFSRVSRGNVSCFSVKKKDGRLRLVVDCRTVNRLFRDALGVLGVILL